MKKILLLFLLCVTCATSCKKDAEEVYDIIVFTGDAVEVTTEANLEDLDSSNLEAAVKTAFGTDYRLANTPLRIKVIGTITSADFETLNYFDEIDLSKTQIVGSIQVGRVVGTPGYGESVSEQWVEGNAIPMSAFINNTKLTRITLATGIPTSDADTFVDGFQPMTIVGVSAFSGCTLLEAINGLDFVTQIGSAAFKGCSILGDDDKVLVSKELVSIGTDAFSGCSRLYEIDLGDSTGGLEIGATAFEDCEALYSVVLPNNLSALGLDAFAGCDALEYITAKMGEDAADSDDITIPTLLSGVIPDQFKASKSNAKIITIEDVAMPAYSDAGGWSDYNLQANTSNGWKIVYNEADSGDNTVNTLTTSLKSMYGSNYASKEDLKVKVTGSMNQADFNSLCYGFESVDLSDVTVVGQIAVSSGFETKASTVTYVEGNAVPSGVFSGSKSEIKNFTIPKTATVIGDAAFEDNKYLESLDLDTEDYLTIGSAAFRGIDKLGGDSGFFGLKDVSGLLVIPANVGEIKDYAFADSGTELETIELRGDKAAPIIGTNAFPDSFKSGASNNLLVPVAAAGLYNTASWKEYNRNKVDFEEDGYGDGVEVEPYCVTNVANESDNTVATLEEQLIAVFGSSYTTEETIIVSGTLNNADFEYLRTFKDVDITDIKIVGTTLSEEGTTSAMALPSYAFCGSTSGRNYNLERIVLPTAVGELSMYSLGYCPNLKTVIFPEGMEITTFGSYTFRASAIEELPGKSGVTADQYTKDKSITGMINFPIDRASYSTGMFYDCTSLHTVDFSKLDKLSCINQAMFQGCTNLSSVKMPTQSAFTDPETKNVFNNIYTLAFYGCTSLDGVTIPETVLYLGDRAFYNCSSLTSIDIPKSIVGATYASFAFSGTFYGCESLVKVTTNWEAQKSDAEIAAGAEQSVVPPSIISYDMNVNYPTFPTSFYGSDATRYITLMGDGGDDVYKDISGWDEINVLEYSDDNILAVVAGGFNAKLLEVYKKASRVPSSLVIGGNMNYDDLAAIANYENIQILDLSSVGFVESTGAATKALPAEAFKNNTSLQIVTLPSDITSIGASAFEGCTSLEIVVIPTTTTEVGEKAFYGCSAMTSVSLPSVTTIGESAFEGCSALAAAALSQEITTIGNKVFRGTALQSMVMPSKITAIPESLFEDCTSMISVSFASGTTAIGASAFKGASAMTSITIPKTVETIGDNAFEGCVLLASVTFESSTETADKNMSIGASAFSACELLKLFSIPTNVNSLGNNMLEGCISLTKIKVYWASGEPVVTTTTFPSTFTTASKAGSIVMPEGVAEYTSSQWGTYNLVAAADDTIETTPGGLEAAILSKWRDFYNKTNEDYPSITVTGSMNSTDFAALQLVTVSDDGVTLNHAFKIVDLSDCVIQNSTIPTSAFAENTSLGELYLPESITTIETSALQGCTNLLTFSFPSSLSSIGSYAFAGTCLVDVSQLRNLESISSYAFYACPILETVDLSLSTKLALTTYSTYVFQSCTSLKSVIFPDEMEILPKYFFYGCSALTDVHLPDQLTTMGEYAFYNCTALQSISIPASVTEIVMNSSTGCDTFSGCTALGSVSLNWETVDTIPEIDSDVFPSQFYASSKNKSLSISASLTADDYATVKGWSTYSFETGGLNTVELTGGSLETAIKSKWGSSWETNIPSTLIVTGTTDDVTGWPSILGGDGTTSLGSVITSLDMSALTISGTKANTIPTDFWSDANGKYKLKTLILPTSVTTIETEAFKSLSSLTSITMASVETIGVSAFESCIGLTSVIFPESIVTIGDSAFKYATGLTSFSTPTRMATDVNRHNITLGESAFEGCVMLSSAGINYGVYSIDDDTFKDCKALTVITLPTTLTKVSSSATTNASAGESTVSPFTGCSSLATVEVQWSADPVLTGFYEDVANNYGTLPVSFAAGNTAGCSIIASETFVDAVTGSSSPWAKYEYLAKSDDMVNSTAGTLATAIALKGNTLGDKITIFGDMNASDFAALASASFTEIDMRYVSVVETVTIEGTRTKLGNAIPAEAFSGNTKMQTLWLPSSVTEIGSSAFLGCSAFKTLNSTAEITYIGGDAFSGCSNLTITKFTDTFKSSVSYVGTNAFSGVIITTLDIPLSLKLTADVGSFFGCNASKIEVPWCYGADDLTAQAASDFALYVAPTIGATTLPVAYSSVGYKYLDFSSSTIGANLAAYGDTDAYGSVVSTDGNGWSNYAFSVNKTTGADDDITVINEIADANDNTVNTLEATIAQKVAFFDFITSPTKTYSKIVVKGQINQADFKSLLRFEELDLSGVTVVGDIVMTATSSSGTAAYYSSSDSSYLGANGSGVWAGAIPAYCFTNLADGMSVDVDIDGGTTIDTGAKPTGSGNTLLKKVTLPMSIQAIGTGAFCNCSALEEVVFPDGMDLYYVGSNAFTYTLITSLTNIPSKLDYTGYGAFQFNDKLTYADFSTASDDLKLAGKFLNDCDLLAYAALPSGFHNALTSAELGFAKACFSTFKIPAGTTSIGTTTFQNITELEEIDIPAAVATIANTAFTNCTGLTRISVNWTTPITVDSSTFPSQFLNGSGEDVRILVPEGYVETYKAASGWSDYSDCIASNVYDTITLPGGEVPSDWLGSGAPSAIFVKGTMTSDDFAKFNGVQCSKLDMSDVTEVTAGTTTTTENTVCAEAFKGNTSLTSILLPTCITEIGDSAFDGCTSLVPEAMTSIMTKIGDRAYAGTLYSETVDLPMSLTSLGSEVFDGCTITAINAYWLYSGTAATIESDTFPSDFALAGGSSAIIVPALATITDVYGSGSSCDWTVNYLLENEPSDSYTVTSVAGALSTCLINQVVGIGPANPLYVLGVMNADDFTTLSEYISDNNLKYIDISGVMLDSTLSSALPEGVFKGLTTLSTFALPSNLLTISKEAFSGCSSLASVTWTSPLGAATIGESAFYGCRSLTSASALLNNKVTTVGASAFSGCSSLTSITLSSTTTEYGADAFADCTKLTTITAADVAVVPTITATTFPTQFVSGSGSDKITIPSGAASVYDSTTWSETYNLSTTTLDVTKETLRFTLTSTADAAAETTTYATVETSVGTLETAIKALGTAYATAYENGDVFEKIVLSGTMNAGDFKAMQNRFRVVDMGDVTVVGRMQSAYSTTSSVTGNSIPYTAFNSDTALEEIIISPNVTRVCPQAFRYSTLKSVYFPSSVYWVQASSFADCPSLESVSFGEGSNWSSQEHEIFMNSTSLKSFTIPSDFTKLASGFFSGSGLVSIDIPATITEFYVYPTSSGVRNIFMSCSNLEVITTHWDAGSEPTIDEYTFPEAFYVGGTKDVSVPVGQVLDTYRKVDGLGLYGLIHEGDIRATSNTVVGTSTVESDTEGDSTLASALAAIATASGNRDDCGELTVGGTLNTADFREIAKYEFTSIDMSAVVSLSEAGLWSTVNAGPAIPEGLFAIETGDDDKLESIILPTSIYKIADNAFKNRANLVSVTLPSNGYGMTYIGESAFEGCTSLTTLNNSGMIREISSRAFYGSGITSIGADDECSLNISGIYASSKSRGSGIGSEAFVGCSDLMTVYFPWSSDVPSIATDVLPEEFEKTYVWEDTLNIRYIVVPDGAAALYSDLAAIYWLAGESDPQPGQEPEAKVDGTTLIIKNLASTEDSETLASLVTEQAGDYSSATTVQISGMMNEADFAWFSSKNFSKIDLSGVVLTGTFTFDSSNSYSFTIPADAFKNKTSLTEFVYPAVTYKVGANAFDGSGITSLTIPATVEEVGASAYANCGSLTSFSLASSASLATLSESMFAGSALTSVTIPASITSVAASVFENCASLSSVTLSSTLTTLSDSMFAGTAISTITIPTAVTTFGANTFNSSSLDEINIKWTVAEAAGVTVTSTTFPSKFAKSGSSTIEIPLGESVADYSGTTLAQYYNLAAAVASATLSADGLTLTVKNVNSIALTSDETTEQNTAHKAIVSAGDDTTTKEAARDTATADSNLKAVMDASGLSIDGVTTIVVTGNINAADYSYVYERFEVVDFSATDFVGYGLVSATSTVENCIPTYAFYDDDVIKEFKMSETVTTLSYSLFTDSTLETIVITDSVTEKIQWGAFYRATYLKYVTLGANALSFANQVFQNCSALEEFVLTWPTTATLSLTSGKESTTFAAEFLIGGAKSFTIPKGATGQGPYATLALYYNLMEEE